MHPWFMRRRFGWGWTPIHWQGWLVLVVALGLIVAASRFIMDVRWFIVALVAITSVLGLVSWLTSRERLEQR